MSNFILCVLGMNTPCQCVNSTQLISRVPFFPPLFPSDPKKDKTVKREAEQDEPDAIPEP
jgi:hypothetical protein